MAMLRPFLLAVFSGLVAVLLQSSPEQLRSRLPGAKRRPDISFRSFSNVLAGVCDDKVCREKLERDAVALGADEVMWMDHAGRGKESTTLEYLARSIFEFHCGDIPDCGGEWWVQFRPTAPKHLPDASKDLPFHWDKDEVENAQANYKGPYLTCVTYLNDATFPTVALGNPNPNPSPILLTLAKFKFVTYIYLFKGFFVLFALQGVVYQCKP